MGGDATGEEEKGVKERTLSRSSRSSHRKSGNTAEVAVVAEVKVRSSFLKRDCAIQDNWKSASERLGSDPCFPRIQQAAMRGL